MREKSKKHMLNIIIIFLIAQPLLDLVTSLMVRFTDVHITIGIVIRALFLVALVIYYVFAFKSKHKKKVLVYLGVVFIYVICFLAIVIFQKGSGSLFAEVKSLFKTFYFPIILICLFDILYTNREHINTKYITITALIYFVLILLPYITGTGFLSYRAYKPGIAGWFYAANEVGTILGLLFLAILSPLLAELKKKQNYKNYCDNDYHLSLHILVV